MVKVNLENKLNEWENCRKQYARKIEEKLKFK